jgi:hypothetical protein
MLSCEQVASMFGAAIDGMIRAIGPTHRHQEPSHSHAAKALIEINRRGGWMG